MAFPDDLLELAQDLAKLRPESPRQASLRRAVSTAYYALFHLLISEATANWARPELRAILGRCFDHGTMLTASTRAARTGTDLGRNPPEAAEKTVAIHLRTVANVFVQAQQRRHDADYDMTKEWTPVEVDTQIASVGEAFRTWNLIRDESTAQAYLVSLLGPRERRPNEPKPQTAKVKGKKKRPGQGSPPIVSGIE
jgi:hypothetical protein